MELEFPHRRIFNTTFVTPSLPGSGASKPVYRISTTHNWTFFPHKTTIEFIGADDPKDHREVAQIIWNWPSQNRSYVYFDGHLYALSQFLGCGEGFMNTDSFITFENETYTWRSNAFEPQLYNSQGRQIVKYKRDPCGLRKPNSLSPLGHLRIDESIASNPMARDAVFTSFFIFKTTRDVRVPWKKPQGGSLSDTVTGEEKQEDVAEQVSASEKTNDEMRPANDGKGECVELPGQA